MTKETKISLAVIAILLGVFGFVLFKKLRAPTDEKVAKGKSATSATTTEGGKKSETLSSGPNNLRVVAPANGDDSTSTSRDSKWQQSGTTADSTAASHRRYAAPGRTGNEQSSAAGRYGPGGSASNGSSSFDTSQPPGPPDYGYASSTDSASQSTSVQVTDPYASSNAYGASPYDSSGQVMQAPQPLRPLDDAVTSSADATIQASDHSQYTRQQEQRQQAAGRGGVSYRSRDYYPRPTAGEPTATDVTPDTTSDVTLPESTVRGSDSGTYTRHDRTYVVQPNESYWAISKKLYGTGAYYRALAAHNQGEYPSADQLRVGAVISAPAAELLQQTHPELCPPEGAVDRAASSTYTVSTQRSYTASGGRTYTVEEGDNLFDIARYELGNAARWLQIYELNRERIGDDIDFLQPGMQLVLPGGSRSDPVTQRPGTIRKY